MPNATETISISHALPTKQTDRPGVATTSSTHFVQTLTGHWNTSSNHGNFFENLKVSEETLFVSLIALGVIVPVVVIALFIFVFYRRRKALRRRRTEQLLRNAQEMALEDYQPVMYKLQSLQI